MRESSVYATRDLAVLGPEAPAWVKQAEARITSPGARLLFGVLVEHAVLSLGCVIPGSQGWLQLCLMNRWVEEQTKAGRDARQTFPSPQFFRRALAELCSAGLVRVVGRGSSCRFELMLPLRPLPQLELPLDAPAHDVFDVSSLRSTPHSKLRLYDPDREPEFEEPVDDRIAAGPGDARVRGGADRRDAAPSSRVGLAPNDADDDGAKQSNNDVGADDPRSPGMLAAFRAACRERLNGIEPAAPAKPAGKPAIESGPRPSQSPRSQPHSSPPVIAAPLSPSLAPASTSTSLRKSTYTNTSTCSPGATPIGDAASAIFQEWLPLESSSDTPRRAVDWLIELRAIDPNLWLDPVVTIRCAIDLGRVPESAVDAVASSAKRGVEPDGTGIAKPGAYLMREWKKLTKAAGLEWWSIAPPKVRRAAEALAAQRGLALKPSSPQPASPQAPTRRSTSASRCAATAKEMAAAWAPQHT